MATYSTGIAVAFDSVDFSEVVDLSWSYGGGPSRGRSVAWTDEAGTVTVGCHGTANTSVSLYGTRATLQISGGGAGLTTPAVWEGVSVAPELNGITKYIVTFRILDN